MVTTLLYVLTVWLYGDRVALCTHCTLYILTVWLYGDRIALCTHCTLYVLTVWLYGDRVAPGLARLCAADPACDHVLLLQLLDGEDVDLGVRVGVGRPPAAVRVVARHRTHLRALAVALLDLGKLRHAARRVERGEADPARHVHRVEAVHGARQLGRRVHARVGAHARYAQHLLCEKQSSLVLSFDQHRQKHYHIVWLYSTYIVFSRKGGRKCFI